MFFSLLTFNQNVWNISHLKVFGNIAYAHASGKFVLISYDLSYKGYKLYNPNNENIIKSRYVKFNEEEETRD